MDNRTADVSKSEELVKENVAKIYKLFPDATEEEFSPEVLSALSTGDAAALFGAARSASLKKKLADEQKKAAAALSAASAESAMGEIASAGKAERFNQHWLNTASTEEISANWEQVYPMIKAGKLKAF